MRVFTLLPAIIVFFLAFPVIVRCQITQNWARGFTASGGYNPRITTDGSGNIYVAGSTASTAYTLIKYNSAGTGQWSTTGAAGSASNGVVGIGVDKSGNVYLVGNGSAGMNVVAYNPSGAQLWSTMLNTGGLAAGATAMAVDGVGNVFIGGTITLSNSIGAYMTARVSGGVQKYLSTFEGSANEFGNVTGIACDNSGNAYVVGTTIQAHTYFTKIIGGPIILQRDSTFDMATVKYDSAGNQVWANVYNAGYEVGDFGFNIAVDPSSGNVYSLGQSQVNGLVGDLIAYSSTGTQLWIQNGSANNNAIAIDASGNIITGGVYYFNISKYTSSGSLTWSYSNSGIVLSGNEAGGYLSMALDKVGNCYVTSPASNFTEYFTAEVSNVGSLAWSTTYSSGPSSGSSGIAIYTPVARLGLAAYPQINVTGVASGATNFTTIQYSYHPTLELSSNSAELNGLADLTTMAPANRLFNYPNPFRGSTTISYTLANDSHVTLQVYDQTGKLVTALFEGDQNAGSYNLPFAADHLAAGIYYYRIIAASPNGNFVQTNSLSIFR